MNSGAVVFLDGAVIKPLLTNLSEDEKESQEWWKKELNMSSSMIFIIRQDGDNQQRQSLEYLSNTYHEFLIPPGAHKLKIISSSPSAGDQELEIREDFLRHKNYQLKVLQTSWLGKLKNLGFSVVK